MTRNYHLPLLIRPQATHGEYIRVTPERLGAPASLPARTQEQQYADKDVGAPSAGWEHLHFAARRMKRGEQWQASTGDFEYGLVILGGVCGVQSSRGNWDKIGRRPNVFSGMPYALYLPAQTTFTITALSEELDLAAGWCKSEGDHPPQLVTPDHVAIEIRGGGNATRQINSLFPPGFNCHRLVAVEVYTPPGSWSSYPPHKHDVHRVDAAGQLIEADLEEIYFYKLDKPQGYAIQRVYTADSRLNETIVARDSDVVLVPEGYHPVASAHGYTTYYLNFLAGSAQSLANTDDPEHAWIKQTWKDKDTRVPVVTLAMETGSAGIPAGDFLCPLHEHAGKDAGAPSGSAPSPT